MQQAIHPTYHKDIEVSCVCGNKFTTGSTKSELKVEICGKCHPFYTGEMKFVDTQGRVEKFQQKMKVATAYAKSKKNEKKGQNQKTPYSSQKTLKEMLQETK